MGNRGYLWGKFLIAAAALKTPTRNGYNAQGVNLKFCFVFNLYSEPRRSLKQPLYRLAFTWYCHYQNCMANIETKGGWGETLYCAIVWAVKGWSGVRKRGSCLRIIVFILVHRPRTKRISCKGQSTDSTPFSETNLPFWSLFACPLPGGLFSWPFFFFSGLVFPIRNVSTTTSPSLKQPLYRRPSLKQSCPLCKGSQQGGTIKGNVWALHSTGSWHFAQLS